MVNESIQNAGGHKGHICHVGRFCILHIGEKLEGLCGACWSMRYTKGEVVV